MSRQNHLFHYHISKKKRLDLFDKVAVLASFMYPLIGLPQALEAVGGNTAGISLPSWIGFMIFSLFFFAYGLIHDIKPMIITNFLWVIVDGAVIFAVLVHK
jgi:uncharacterized protein with PQ loop repeat